MQFFVLIQISNSCTYTALFVTSSHSHKNVTLSYFRKQLDIPYRVLNVCQPCLLHGSILRPAEFGPRRETLALVSVSAWHANATIQQQQPVPDAEQMAVKHLRHVTANLVELESDCSTLVATDCVSNATIHLQHKENSTCEYARSFISYQNVFVHVPCICSIMAIRSQDSQSPFNDRKLTQGTALSVGWVHDIEYMDWKIRNIGSICSKIQTQIPNIHFI